MTRKTLAWSMLIPFTLLTFYAIYKVGYWGVIDNQLHNPAGWQVFADLIIACVLLLTLIWPDAKKTGRNIWPYLIITVFLGSFGPLLYIVMARSNSRTQSAKGTDLK